MLWTLSSLYEDGVKIWRRVNNSMAHTNWLSQLKFLINQVTYSAIQYGYSIPSTRRFYHETMNVETKRWREKMQNTSSVKTSLDYLILYIFFEGITSSLLAKHNVLYMHEKFSQSYDQSVSLVDNFDDEQIYISSNLQIYSLVSFECVVGELTL